MENQDFSEMNHRDITAMIKDGMIKTVVTEGKDGKPEIELRIDDRSAWWKTHIINSSRFGRLARAVESFEALAHEAQYNMSAQRAAVIKEQVLKFVDVERKAIDAKSSEAMRDGRNATTSLVDKYLKNKQERVLDVKGEVKRSLLDAVRGKELERDN